MFPYGVSEWGDEKWVRAAIGGGGSCWAGWGNEPKVFRIWSKALPSTTDPDSILLGMSESAEGAWWSARQHPTVVAYESRLRSEWEMREKQPVPDRNPCKTLSELLEGVTVNIGLRQQGHMETVTVMRSEGKSWDEIGKHIGWAGSAVEEWYAMESKVQAEASEARTKSEGCKYRGYVWGSYNPSLTVACVVCGAVREGLDGLAHPPAPRE